MKLQLALDFLDRDTAIKIAKETVDYVDWIEAGTTITWVEGFQFIRDLRKLFPNKKILADLKIITGETYIAKYAFEAGADIVQVQACATDTVIRSAISIARECNKEIIVDVLGYLGDKVKRCIEVDKLGADYIGVLANGFKDDPNYVLLVKKIVNAVKKPVAVGGGLNLDYLDQMFKVVKPEIIIIGGAIIRSPNPREAAKALKEKLLEESKL